MIVFASVTASDPLTAAAVVLGAVVAATLLCRPVAVHLAQLPLMRHLPPVLAGALGALGLVVLTPGGSDPLALALLPVLLLAVSTLVERPLRRSHGPVRRVALLGPDQTAESILKELRENGLQDRIELVGRIAVGPADPAGRVATLGSLDETAAIVAEHHIDLLVLSPEIPRLPVFETLAASILELPVRLVDLGHFCESVFGHVPIRSINATWFQYLMHPRFKHGPSVVKRAMDLVIAGAVALPLLPLLAILAPLVRRDGGPLFFKQTRIGEGGRPFSIYKLRTMTVSDGPSEWTADGDSRVTPVGRLLRRTHLDELPQVINVLRGEMSIVGPRPEQPNYVDSLESAIPYYSRRHLIKPGITGWAQVRCGYAGSVEGSAWKLCHDLYYVKHRSVALDLVILGETLRTLFADRQYARTVAPISSSAIPVAQEGMLAAS